MLLQPGEQCCAHLLWLCLRFLLCLLSLMLLKLLAEDCFFAWQLLVVAYDDGEPPRENSALVEITVLQPSVIPVFTREEYRYRTGMHGPTHRLWLISADTRRRRVYETYRRASNKFMWTSPWVCCIQRLYFQQYLNQFNPFRAVTADKQEPTCHHLMLEQSLD